MTVPSGAGDAPIFLIGFMASGKSTVGRLVAARLGWDFRDLDEAIEAAAGRSIPEIFALEGEPAFRQREAEAVREAATLRRTVVATGGGAPCREESLALMLAVGRVVALAVSPEEVARRAASRPTRPLLAGAADPRAVAAALLAVRAPFYARAHACVETQDRAPSQVAADVLRVIEALSP